MFQYIIFFYSREGVPTVEHVPNCRDNCDERAPPNLHTAELAEGHVETIGSSLDFDKRLFLFGRQAWWQSLALAFGFRMASSGGETCGWDGLEVRIIAALVVGGIFTQNSVENKSRD